MASAQGRIRIRGGKELLRKLQALDEAVRKELMMAALKAAAEPIRAEASKRAPKRTGKLSDKIIVEESEKAEYTVLVGPHKDAFYGMFQELGTSRHKAQPFLRPAVEAKKAAASREAGRTLREGIEGVVR